MNEEKKDLTYWKKNCDEELKATPISVLRYITQLEQVVNKSSVIHDVMKWHKLPPKSHNLLISDGDDSYTCASVKKIVFELETGEESEGYATHWMIPKLPIS